MFLDCLIDKLARPWLQFMLPVWNRPQDQTQLLLQIKISIHWYAVALLSKKKSVLRLRKSKKNNATVSLVVTARFTPQSAWDIFVIKLGRHACLDKAIWHAVWQAPERGYGPGWPEVPLRSLHLLVLRTAVLAWTLFGTSDPGYKNQCTKFEIIAVSRPCTNVFWLRYHFKALTE